MTGPPQCGLLASVMICTARYNILAKDIWLKLGLQTSALSRYLLSPTSIPR
jgi:hypothetical protein